MTQRQKFSDEQWETLRYAPNWMGMYVAFADGTPGEDELKAMLESFAEVVESPSSLLLEVILDYVANIETVLPAYKADRRSYIEGLRDVGRVVDDKVSAREAEVFKEALLEIGEKVANATGGIFGLHKISKEERKRLDTARNLLGA